MKKRNNSAGRLLKVFETVRDQEDQKYLRDVWREIFSANPDDGYEALYDVQSKLKLLYGELHKARAAMKNTDYSPNLYEAGFVGVEQVLYPEFISNRLENMRAHLSDVVFASLLFSAETMQDEEDEVSEEELNKLQGDLTAFKQKVQAGNLPDYVKSFIFRQISIIEEATRDYQLIGAIAFKEALNTAIIDYGENRDLVKEYQDTVEMRTTKSFLKRVFTFGGKTIKIGSYIHSIYKMVETGMNIIDKW